MCWLKQMHRQNVELPHEQINIVTTVTLLHAGRVPDSEGGCLGDQQLDDQWTQGTGNICLLVATETPIIIVFHQVP